MIYEGTSLLPTPFLGLYVPASAPFPALCQHKCLCRWGENEVMELIWLGKSRSQKNLGSPQAKQNKNEKQTKPTAKNGCKTAKWEATISECIQAVTHPSFSHIFAQDRMRMEHACRFFQHFRAAALLLWSCSLTPSYSGRVDK